MACTVLYRCLHAESVMTESLGDAEKCHSKDYGRTMVAVFASLREWLMWKKCIGRRSLDQFPANEDKQTGLSGEAEMWCCANFLAAHPQRPAVTGTSPQDVLYGRDWMASISAWQLVVLEGEVWKEWGFGAISIHRRRSLQGTGCSELFARSVSI